MEKTVKLGHLLIALLALLGSWLGGWINVRQTLAVHDNKINSVEQVQADMRNTQRLSEATQYARHYELIKAINELRIIVENKQNRQ